MRIIPVINRLKTACALLNGRAEPAQSLSALTDDEVRSSLPIAFIYSEKESAHPNEMLGITSQLVPKRFCIITAAQPSTAIAEPIEDIRDQVKTALIGWCPDANHEPIEFVGGEIIDVSTSVVWWKDMFQTFTYNRG